MTDILFYILAFITGLALGTLFFAGLWFTVKKTVHTKLPGLWFIGSLFVRLGMVLLGFYLVGNGSWQRLLICLAGFIIARFIVVQYTRVDKKGGKHEI